MLVLGLLLMASSTTLIAAHRVGLRCFGIELDALYVDTAIRRWQKFTVGQASLAGDGRCFEEVEASGRAAL